MITAVDTNILLDVFLADAVYGLASASALRKAMREGPLVACAAVWAEVGSALPEGSGSDALDRLGVQFDPATKASAALAGSMWRRYRDRGGLRTRVVADFLIGAHAQRQADRLLTRDPGFFRDYFEGLSVLTP